MAPDVGEMKVLVELALGRTLSFKVFRAWKKPWSLSSDTVIMFPLRKVKVPDSHLLRCVFMTSGAILRVAGWFSWWNMSLLVSGL